MQLDREHRMRASTQARNEGIREGLLMAMEAQRPQLGYSMDAAESEAIYDCVERIKARGNRHFGDEEWQTKSRPG